MAARAAVDGEGFGVVLARREVPFATGNRGRSGRDVLAGRPPVIEQDEQDGLPPHVDRRLSQSLSHAGWTLLVETACSMGITSRTSGALLHCRRLPAQRRFIR